MVGAELFSNHTSVRSLIKVRTLKTDGESLYRSRTRARHQRHNGRRIYATAQQGPERHVSDQPDAHRLGKLFFKLLKALFFTGRRVCSELGQIPILAGVNISSLEFQEMTGRKFMDRGEGCSRTRDVSKMKILQKSLRVDRRKFRCPGQNGLDLRSKKKTSA